MTDVRDALSHDVGTHIAECKECPVKEEHDTQEHEEPTGRCEGHTNLYRRGLSSA